MRSAAILGLFFVAAGGTGCATTERYVLDRATIAPLLSAPDRLPPDGSTERRRFGQTVLSVKHDPDLEERTPDLAQGYDATGERLARHRYRVSGVDERGRPVRDVVNGAPRASESAAVVLEEAPPFGGAPLPTPATHVDTPAAIDAIARGVFIEHAWVATTSDPRGQRYVHAPALKLVADDPSSPVMRLEYRRSRARLVGGLALCGVALLAGAGAAVLLSQDVPLDKFFGTVTALSAGAFAAGGITLDIVSAFDGREETRRPGPGAILLRPPVRAGLGLRLLF